MKVLTKRLQKTPNENQPREQAGFRSIYSMTDHIHVVNQLKKCREYNIPLCVAFVSVQTQAVLTSLQEQRIEDVYIEILKEIYTNSSMTVHLHKESNITNIRRGIRISPKPFNCSTRKHIPTTDLKKQMLEDILVIFTSPMTYAYVLIHHMNYNKCYRN